MAREDPHFRLRLPEELHDRVRIAAAINRRSITAEVVARLQDSFAHSNSPPEVDVRAILRDAVNESIEQLLGDPERLAAIMKKAGRD